MSERGAAGEGGTEASAAAARQVHEWQIPAEVREDLRQARRLGRRILRLQRDDPRYLRCQSRANHLLALEWLLLIAGSYLLVYGPLPWQVKALLLVPWSIYSSLALDVAIHYFNHWPLFEREWLNRTLRGLGVLVLTCPLEVRYHHWEHHRYSDPDDDPQETLASIQTAPGLRGWLALARYLTVEMTRSVRGFLPLAPLPPYIAGLRRSRPAHHAEIALARWACPAWLIVLLAWRWRETLLLFIPSTLLVAPLASFLMNLTDHAPSDLRHPFRQATWLEPATRLGRLFSWVNHYTAATHLTHHLFPQVHWVHVRRLQRRLRPLYARYEAPHSLIVNSLLLGNPLALASVLSALREERGPAARWPAPS